MRRILVATGLAMLAAACRSTPRVVYEYEEPVTTVSGPAEDDLFTPTTTTLPAAPPSVWRHGERR